MLLKKLKQARGEKDHSVKMKVEHHHRFAFSEKPILISEREKEREEKLESEILSVRVFSSFHNI
jgi:hypothetical protein